MFIATIPAVLWIDRVGRKPVLTVGAVGMGVCHLIIAVILAKNIGRFEEREAAGWAAIVMVWLFVVHFGCESTAPGKELIVVKEKSVVCYADTQTSRLLGSLCLDHHCGNLASEHSAVRCISRSIKQLDVSSPSPVSS